MECANHSCLRLADYFPALRVIGADDGKCMILGLPLCHECSKYIEIRELVPSDKYMKVKKALAKLGQDVVCVKKDKSGRILEATITFS